MKCVYCSCMCVDTKPSSGDYRLRLLTALLLT